MKKIYSVLGLITLLTISSCSADFLVENPKGVLSQDVLVTPENVEGFMNAAYSSLGNDHYDVPFSLWPYGNVRSDDAYKGGSGPNDIQAFHFFEVSNNIRTDFGELDRFWYNSYVGISRANKALAALNQLTKEQYPLKETRKAEMLFLRGHFYFMLKIMFRNIPYVTEVTPIADYAKISNRELSNDQLWDAIASDFQAAADQLPQTQPEIGRATKMAAYSYLAKVRLYQAYQQDDKYNVVSINQERLQQVIDATNQVIGKAQLESDFGNNFMPGEYENGKESIFAIQYSANDGTLHGRINYSDVLATPQGIGCCDFHKPSQNLVNAFKTSTGGLPLFDTYNNEDLNYKQISNYDVDPRLYHTVAIPGLPWKYSTDLTFQENWNRSPDTYGNYASLKENVDPACNCLINVDPFYGNTKNRIQIRYADVILMRAEAYIELGQYNEALPLINQIRKRASQSNKFTSAYDSNVKIAEYINGTNCTWTQEFARQALRWERRLEFAMEGSRFFDLVRWGIVDQTLNNYYNIEKTKRSFFNDAHFDKNKEEYCPIPLAQINFSQGLYQQNTGY